MVGAPAVADALRTTLHAGLGKALKHERHHEIDQLEQAWCTAVLHGDADALGNLLADDYISITAKGMLQTKTQALENIRTRQTQIVSLVLSDRKVRFYGLTAVVTSLAHVQGTKDNEDISGQLPLYARLRAQRRGLLEAGKRGVQPHSGGTREYPIAHCFRLPRSCTGNSHA